MIRPMPATPAWPPRSAPRLFVEAQLTDGMIVRLDGNAAHYLAQVMRCRPGDTVILLDNITGEWAAQLDRIDRRVVEARVINMLRAREEVPDLQLCVAPIKKPHFDMVIEKATELGVARITPVLMRRCVVDKVNGERMRAITTEAAEQCARTSLPVIDPLTPLSELLANWQEGRTLFHADEAGGNAAAASFATIGGPAAILIGPEGGFDPAERDAIRAVGSATAVTLGPRILRAETAAIAAIGLWMAGAGDWR